MTKQPFMFPRAGLTLALATSFTAFWKAYPRRSPNPRSMAEAAFLAAVKGGAEPAQLVAAAGAYAAEVRAKGIQESFIVHASTFLRQRRFLDYLPDPAAEMTPAPAEPAHELWPELVSHMEASDFRAWIGRCRVVSFDDAALVLGAPSTFVAARIRQDYVLLLQRALDRTVTVVVEPTR